ncbi:hypothetical protein GAO09_19400 [Rhizobiales bacterium RZME27]|uniref:Uncharacterized protein n=1 Tax=Endobacterium cereale TaxID=2663029 RepID=A0A6A8ABU6_9HYPH|nr:hypothetical protein [Endobacterium cereale]MQY48204.1 hypothetical protein [Endobacterium cereale]
MAIEKPTEEQLNEVLDIIHDIAARVSSEEDIPREVAVALDEIIALSRYESNVTNSKRR